MKRIVLLLFALLPSLGMTQQRALPAFFRLSAAEKVWTLAHPCVALQAWRITLTTRHLTDSLQRVGNPDRDPAGGRLDAFRHGFWMAKLSSVIGPRKALSLGRAHERGNYRDFKRHRLEEGALSDEPASFMDMFNNRVGAMIGQRMRHATSAALRDSVLQNIRKGKLRILLKDAQGRSCDSLFQPIPDSLLMHRWHTPRVLVPSNTLIQK